MSEPVSPLQGESPTPFEFPEGSGDWWIGAEWAGTSLLKTDGHLFEYPSGNRVLLRPSMIADGFSRGYYYGLLDDGGAKLYQTCPPPASSLDGDREEARLYEDLGRKLSAYCAPNSDASALGPYLAALQAVRDIEAKAKAEAVKEETREWITKGTYNGYSVNSEEGRMVLRIAVSEEFFGSLPLSELGSCSLTLRRKA